MKNHNCLQEITDYTGSAGVDKMTVEIPLMKASLETGAQALTIQLPVKCIDARNVSRAPVFKVFCGRYCPVIPK